MSSHLDGGLGQVVRVPQPGCDVESEVTAVLYDVLTKPDVLQRTHTTSLNMTSSVHVCGESVQIIAYMYMCVCHITEQKDCLRKY